MSHQWEKDQCVGCDSCPRKSQLQETFLRGGSEKWNFPFFLCRFGVHKLSWSTAHRYLHLFSENTLHSELLTTQNTCLLSTCKCPQNNDVTLLLLPVFRVMVTSAFTICDDRPERSIAGAEPTPDKLRKKPTEHQWRHGNEQLTSFLLLLG